MKKTYFILFILSLASVFGAYTPSTASSTVMVNGSGIVVSPSNFKTANYILSSTVSTLSLTGITATTATISTLSGSPHVSGGLTSLTISTGTATISTLSAGVASFSQTPTVSPTRWYAVVYLPQSTPQLTISGGTLSATYWTDFKLKGFLQSPTISDTVVELKFRYVSYDPSYSIYPQYGTTRPTVFFTRSNNVDARFWTKQDTVNTIASYLITGARVGGWVAIVTDDGAWFSPYNRNLLWNYTLCTSTGPEEDAAGNTIWRPISPIWTDKPIDPTQ